MLDPYDGAKRVRLPDGTECWEKETITHGGSESFHTFQYSVSVDLFETDYDGRVENLEVWDDELKEWALVVTYFPVTMSAVNRCREAINSGWAKHSELLIPENVDEGVVMDRVMGAKGYLEIYTEVMDTIMNYHRGE